MTTTLGIHLGHHASCAVVADGVLLAAIAQERITRRKHDGQLMLSNRLPVRECLDAAGVRLGDVDGIVSSFQSAAVGGIGLRAPLVEPGFDLFDAWDARHLVISHHLAHAACAFGCSGFEDAAVVVCDLGGSTTTTGEDFELRFTDYHAALTEAQGSPAVKTEAASIYEIGPDGPVLKHREFGVPHCAPDVFIHSAGSLYDNVSRSVFGSENAHGQLMALAALEPRAGAGAVDPAEMLAERGGCLLFKNGWQSRVRLGRDPLDNIGLARAAQSAMQTALLFYARRARELCASDSFCAAGGVFLNILANSQIADSGLYERCYFPSSPHDAGIAIGCAFHGQKIWRRPNTAYARRYVSDRLGPRVSDRSALSAVDRHAPFVKHAGPATPEQVAALLAGGMILARCAGRSEFGPRALGGRSLLASPLLSSSKDRLNHIKGRQPWRPVAPITPADRLEEFFSGPPCSPYMNYVHLVRPEHRDRLPALAHADGSTRAQSLLEDDDPELFAILRSFGQLTGFPILVNTSLNGPREPIVETADQAVSFYLANGDVDALLLNELLVLRDPEWDSPEARLRLVRVAHDTLISTVFPASGPCSLLLRGSRSLEIAPALAALLSERSPPLRLGALLSAAQPLGGDAVARVRRLFDGGFLLLDGRS